MINPRLEHDGQNVVLAEADGTEDFSVWPRERRKADSIEIVRGIYAAKCRQRERRKESAARGVETRRHRDALELYRVAARWMQHVVEPSDTCRVCGRGFSDPASRERGIGPECIDRVVAVANAMAVTLTHRGHRLPLTREEVVRYVRDALGEATA
jgi:hypothetical protein